MNEQTQTFFNGRFPYPQCARCGRAVERVTESINELLSVRVFRFECHGAIESAELGQLEMELARLGPASFAIAIGRCFEDNEKLLRSGGTFANALPAWADKRSSAEIIDDLRGTMQRFAALPPPVVRLECGDPKALTAALERAGMPRVGTQHRELLQGFGCVLPGQIPIVASDNVPRDEVWAIDANGDRVLVVKIPAKTAGP